MVLFLNLIIDLSQKINAAGYEQFQNLLVTKKVAFKH